MLKRSILCVALAFLLSSSVFNNSVYAIGIGDITPEGSSNSTVWNYGWQGLLTGMLAGLAGGFVRYAGENNNSEVLRSVGYGAVAGSGFGLALGIYDMNEGQPGFGGLLLKDMNLGGAFGLVVGSVYGGIDAIRSNDWKSLGNGASWGYLSGLVVGTGLAIYENSRPGGSLTCADNDQIIYSVVMLRDSSGAPCTGVGATCRF